MKNYLDFVTKEPEYFGINNFCNICGYNFSHFAPYGITPRPAKCPVCGSLERHRHLFIHLLPLLPFLEGGNILHFAPEPIIKNIFANCKANYYDCDIDAKKAAYKVDISNIKFKDNFFDLIICIHVLEHIKDDGKAIKELYRVMKPGGKAFICVPLAKEFSEDVNITDPAMRAKLFGQSDHFRCYTKNVLKGRLLNGAFPDVKISVPENFPQLYKRALLGDEIFICSKN